MGISGSTESKVTFTDDLSSKFWIFIAWEGFRCYIILLKVIGDSGIKFEEHDSTTDRPRLIFND
jgi:hypothetical protein